MGPSTSFLQDMYRQRKRPYHLVSDTIPRHNQVFRCRRWIVTVLHFLFLLMHHGIHLKLRLKVTKSQRRVAETPVAWSRIGFAPIDSSILASSCLGLAFMRGQMSHILGNFPEITLLNCKSRAQGSSISFSGRNFVVKDKQWDDSFLLICISRGIRSFGWAVGQYSFLQSGVGLSASFEDHISDTISSSAVINILLDSSAHGASETDLPKPQIAAFVSKFKPVGFCEDRSPVNLGLSCQKGDLGLLTQTRPFDVFWLSAVERARKNYFGW